MRQGREQFDGRNSGKQGLAREWSRWLGGRYSSEQSASMERVRAGRVRQGGERRARPVLFIEGEGKGRGTRVEGSAGVHQSY